LGPRAPQGANVPLSALPQGTIIEPVVFTSADGALSRGLFYRPAGRRPRVGVHLMHPRTDQSLNYNVPPLVQAGYAVVGRAGRAVNNDVDTVHEEILLVTDSGSRSPESATTPRSSSVTGRLSSTGCGASMSSPGRP
jgi:hypothetical protein